jgi:uncharacterized membrane protein (DUF4010 family)
LLVTGAVVGLTDVDALTMSMAKVVASPDHAVIAAQAIAVGMLANSLLKIGLAAALGTPQFRRLTVVFVGAMAFAIAVSIGIVR